MTAAARPVATTPLQEDLAVGSRSRLSAMATTRARAPWGTGRDALVLAEGRSVVRSWPTRKRLALENPARHATGARTSDLSSRDGTPGSPDLHHRSRPWGAPLALLLVLFTPAACTREREDLTVSVPYDVKTLDPHAWNYLGEFTIASHFYEPLVTTDAEMRLRPCLAERWENPDPLSWTLHLRQGVAFHSGRPLRARDVVYTLNRLRTEQGLEMSSRVGDVSDVRALDDLTIRIRTTRPVIILLHHLRFVAIVPEGAGEGLAEAVDGTGPYRLAEWKKGDSLRMARNERYWGSRPAFASVTFRTGREPEPAAEDLLTGSSQLVQCDSAAAVAPLERTGRFQVWRHTNIRLDYLAFDLSHEVTPHASARTNPFRDRRVRQAIHQTLDRRRLAEDGAGRSVPAHQLVPPFVFGFDPQVPESVPDPENARRLLEAAGYPRGFRATLHTRSLFREVAEEVSRQLLPVGIEVDVRLEASAEFFERLRRGDVGMYILGFGCVTGDASEVLENGIHTRDDAGRWGPHNYGGYSNAELDQLIEAGAGLEDLKARGPHLAQTMSRVMEEVPWIPLRFERDLYAAEKTLAWRPRHDSFILAHEAAPRSR